MEFVMLGLIALLIIFMFRNGKKRQRAMQELQAGLVPGAEVILQPGIFATIEEIDEEEQRMTVRSGTSSFVVHRNMVAQVVPEYTETEETTSLAPDDDPAFGERFPESPAPEVTDTTDASASHDAAAPGSEPGTSSPQTDEPDSDAGDSSSDNRPA